MKLIKGYMTTILLVSLFIACSTSPKVDVFVDEGSCFPIISIANPAGERVKIEPLSAEIGSIGFEKDSIVQWIKGTPEIKMDEAAGRVYQWCIDSLTAVQLQLNMENEDVKFSLSLINADQTETTQWFVNIGADQDEYFTGVFERVVDGHQNNSWADSIETAMNLRGERVEMKLKPTVSAYAPFYISSNHYGFFAEGTWPGVFDFCKENQNSVQISFEGPALTFKIYTGSTPMQIVQRHGLETGPSIVPPKWALGPWRWRDNHVHRNTYYDGTDVHAPYNSELVEDVLMMKAYDIPLTAYWIDRPWGPGVRGFDDYEFDPERFPEAQEMIAWLNGQDIELMMWIAPFVMGKMADYAEEKGYFLKSNTWKNSRQVLMDFTNQEAVAWWSENGPGKLARMGIKGLKLDRADGEKLMDSLSLKTSIGTTYRQNYNDYPRQYVQAAYKGMKQVLGDNFILFPRAQYTGSAQYGAMWAGDTKGKPEGLRSAIIGMQRCTVMGYPLWGSDTGGYWGRFSNETCMRWLAFSCFSPLMEVGPTNDQGLWNNPTKPHYDAELIAAWRLYSKIRMKLIPYLMALVKKAHESGAPIVRPLFLVYPEQQNAWEDWQTYLLGPDILVSAIWQSGKEHHKLYLPAGEEWIDAWNTGKTYTGGKTIEVEAPKYKIPVFIRKGAQIDLMNLNELYQESLEIASQKPDLAALEKAEGWR